MSPMAMPIRLAMAPEPFRFLDLPPEIRNKVYGLFLTVPNFPRRLKRAVDDGWETADEDDDQDIGASERVEEVEDRGEGGDDAKAFRPQPLVINLETNILCVSRSVNLEAEYVLRTTNLFVRLTIKARHEEFAELMYYTPMFPLAMKHYKNFKAHVVSHEITVPDPLVEETIVRIFLHRDLESACDSLMLGQPNITQHRNLMSHIITLWEPCVGKLAPDQKPYLSKEIQQKLVAPYRAKLHDFPHLEFKGRIARGLKLAAGKEINRPFPIGPEAVIREVEALKAEGNMFIQRGCLYHVDGTGGASEYWHKALKMIDRVMEDDSYYGIREAGGAQFLNRLAELAFECNSNKAQDYLKCMRYHSNSQQRLDEFGLKLSDAVWAAMCVPTKYPTSTWKPNAQQMAKLAYRKAIRCRLGGDSFMLPQAEAAIEQALLAFPNDAQIMQERTRIAHWRMLSEA